MKPSLMWKNLFDPNIPGVYFELLYIGFSIMMGMSLSSSFLPILANELDPSGVLVGLVVSSWFISRVFIELPAGIISDRVGRRRLLVFGLALSFFGPIVCSQAGNIYVLIFGRAVWGMGTALYFMSNMALLMDILPPASRGRALGIFQGIEFIGSFIGAPIGAFLASYLSFTDVFYFTSFFMLTSFAIAFKSSNITDLEDQHRNEAQINLRQIFNSLGNLNLIIICVCNLFRMFMRFGIYQTVLQLYLNQDLGFSIGEIGWVISLRVAGMVLFLFIAGLLSDRYGRKPVLVAGYLISGAALIAFSWANNLLFLLLSGFLAGMGDGFDMATLSALLTDIAPSTARGVAVGLYRTFQDVGGFLGPILFMIVYTGFNSSLVFYIGVVLCFFNIFLVTRIRQT